MLNLNYYLLAEQLVPVEENQFDSDVGQFLDLKGFKRLVPTFDNKLTLALKSTQPIVYDSYTRQDDPSKLSALRKTAKDSRIGTEKLVYQYLHLWRVSDKADLALAEVMIRCADDDLYARINGRVVREIQNFVVDVKWLASKKPLVSDPDAEIVAVSKRFRSADMGRYLSVVGSLFPSMDKQGWTLIGYYQNVTGPLNSVTELWRRKGTPKEPQPSTALNGLLAQLPAKFRKFEELQYQSTLSFKLAPYDPQRPKIHRATAT